MLILTALLLLASPVTAGKKTANRIRNKITIFPTIFKAKTPVLLYGQLENRLLATFSSLGSFACEPMSGIHLNSSARKRLAASLLTLSTNSDARVAPLEAGKEILNVAMQKKLSASYLLIFPELTRFKLIQNFRVITNRLAGPGTNTITVVTNRFRLNTSVTIYTLNPFDGRIRRFTTIDSSSDSINRFTAFSGAVDNIGRQLARKIENSTIFDLDTEINHVRGNTVYCFHKHPYPLFPGQECTFFEQKRYDDGFVDELRRGTIRIIEKKGAFWSARIIEGTAGKKGWKIRSEPRAGITIMPLFRFAMPGLNGSTFSPPVDTDYSPEAVDYLYGPALEAGFQIGFNFQFHLGGSWLFDRAVDFKQLAAGFGWDIYAARNLFFSAKISLLFGWINHNFGKINDGGGLDGKTLTAFTFTPGMEGGFALNWILGRIFGGFFIFRLESGYNQFARISPGGWSYEAGGSKADGYAPKTVKTVNPGGFYSTAGFSIRL